MNYEKAKISIQDYNNALQRNAVTQEEWNSILQQSDATLTKYLSNMDRLNSKASYEGYKGHFAGSNITPVGISGVNNAIKEYKKISVQGTDATKGFIAAISSQNQNLANYLTNLNGAKAGMLGYGVSLIGATAKSVGLTIATTALNTALTMGISFLITSGITALMTWVDSLTMSEKKLKEIKDAAKNAESEIKNLTDSFNELKKDTNDVKERFAELAQGVENLGKVNQNRGKLSNDDYKEFLDISNSLSELFPELTIGYDDNGNAILELSGDVDTIVGSLNHLVDVQEILAIQDIEDNLPDILEGRKAAIDDYNKKLEESKKKSSLFEALSLNISNKEFTEIKDRNEFNKIIDNLKKAGIKEEDIYSSGAIQTKAEKTGWNSIFSKYGITDYNTIGIDWNKLTDIQLDEIDSCFSSLSSGYADEMGAYNSKIKSENSKAISSISKVLLTDANTTYKDFNNIQKNLASDILLSEDWLSLVPDTVDIKNWDELSIWLETNILQSIKNIDNDEIQSNLAKALDNSLSLEDDISLKDTLMKSINKGGAGLDEDNPIVVYLTTKISNLEEQKKSFEKSIEDISNGSDIEKTRLSEFTKDFTNEQQELWLKSTLGVKNATEAINAYKKATATTINEVLEAYNPELVDYAKIMSEVQANGIDLSKTIYGNIDTNNREAITWTNELLDANKDALIDFTEATEENWDEFKKDMEGTVSTVLGGSMSFGEGQDAIEIAFSPMLQTENGAELLTKDAVANYIDGLIKTLNKTKGEWNTEDLLKLDAENKSLIADVGETAKATGVAMHYTGTLGAVANAVKDVDKASKSASVSSTELIRNFIKGDVTPFIKGLEQYSEKLPKTFAEIYNTSDEKEGKKATERITKFTTEVSNLQSAITSLYNTSLNKSDLLTSVSNIQQVISEYKVAYNDIANYLSDDLQDKFKLGLDGYNISDKTKTLDLEFLLAIEDEAERTEIALATVQAAAEKSAEALIKAQGIDPNSDLAKHFKELAVEQAIVKAKQDGINQAFESFKSVTSSLKSSLETLYSGTSDPQQLLDALLSVKNTFEKEGMKFDLSSLESANDLLEVIGTKYSDFIESQIKAMDIPEDSPLAKMLHKVAQEAVGAKAKLTGLSTQISNLSSNYNTIKSAVDEYNNSNGISIDTLSSLLTMDSRYLECLEVEGGQLKLNKEAYKNLRKELVKNITETKIAELEEQKQAIYLEQIEENANNNKTALGKMFDDFLKNSSGIGEILEGIIQGIFGVGEAVSTVTGQEIDYSLLSPERLKAVQKIDDDIAKVRAMGKAAENGEDGDANEDSAPHRDETNDNYYDYYSAMLEDREKALEKFTKGNEKLDELFQKAVNRGDTEAMNNIIEQRKANNDAYQKALNNSVSSTAKSQQDALKRLYAIAPEFRGMSVEQIVGNKQLQTTVDKRFDDALVSNSNAQYKAEQGKDWTKKAGLEDNAKVLNQNKSEVSSIISFLENSSNDIESWNSALNNSYKETADSIKSMYDQMLGFNEDKRAKFEMIDGSEQDQIDTLKDDLSILAKEKQDLLNIKDNNGESVFTEQSEEVRELDNRVRETLKDIYALNDEIFGRKIDRNETDISRLENAYASEEKQREIYLKNMGLYHSWNEDLRNQVVDGINIYNEDSPEILENQDKYMDNLRKYYDSFIQEHERKQEEISDRIGTIDFKIEMTEDSDFATKSSLLLEKTHLIKDSIWNVEQQKKRLDEQFANNRDSAQYVEAMKSLTKESQELYKELNSVYEAEKQLQQERANTIKEVEDKVIEMLEDKYKKIKDNYQKRINLEKEYIDNRKDLLNKLLDAYEKKWKAEDEDEKRQDKLNDRAKLVDKRNDFASAASSGDLEALSQMEDLNEQIADADKELADDSKESYRQSVRDRIKDEIDSLDDLSKQYDLDLERFNALIDQKLEKENLYAEAHKDIIEGTFTDAYGRVISLTEAFDQYMKENSTGFSWLAEVDLSNFNESLIDTNNNLKDLRDIIGQISGLGVREFLESLGYDVKWDNNSKEAIVNGVRISQDEFGNNRDSEGKLVGTAAQIMSVLAKNNLGKYNVSPQEDVENADTKEGLQYDKDNIKMPDYNEKGYDMNMTVEGFKKALEGTDTTKFTASFKESLNDSILKDIHNEMKNLTGNVKYKIKSSDDDKVIHQTLSVEKFEGKNEELWFEAKDFVSSLNTDAYALNNDYTKNLSSDVSQIKDAFVKNVENINKPPVIEMDNSVTIQGNVDSVTMPQLEKALKNQEANFGKIAAKQFNVTLSNNGTIGRIMR